MDFKMDDYLQKIIREVIRGDDAMTLYELDEPFMFKDLHPHDLVVVRPIGDSDYTKRVDGTILKIEEVCGFQKIFIMANDERYNTEYDVDERRPYFTIVDR